MVLFPEGLHALKQVATEVGLDLHGAYVNLDGGLVAYPLAAANISRPLVSRLKSLHQPVVRARIRFSALRSRLLACVSTGLSPVV